jgi:hypothetical protein
MTVKDSHTLGLGSLQRSRYSDSVRDIRSGNRNLVGARFSIPVQTDTMPHSAPFTMNNVSLSPVIKRPGRVVEHAPLSTDEVKESVELYIFSTLRCVIPIVL